jgi:hypothetical protein
MTHLSELDDLKAEDVQMSEQREFEDAQSEGRYATIIDSVAGRQMRSDGGSGARVVQELLKQQTERELLGHDGKIVNTLAEDIRKDRSFERDGDPSAVKLTATS